MAEVLSEMTWGFAGNVPEVPFAAGLDPTEWKADESDPQKRPLFVTLPLVKIGARSQNGIEWTRSRALRIVNEINDKRPEGIVGHIPLEKRSTDYRLPSLRWVGAMLDERNLLVWGKAYVPNYAQDVREFLIDAKRARARVGTSVYGTRGEKGIEDMTLESIDLGHPDRVSLPDAAAVPKLTAELHNESVNKGGDTNPMETELKLVSELTTQKDNALRQVSELTSKLGEKDNQIAEMQSKVSVLSGLEKLVAEFSGATVTEKLEKLVAEVRDLRAKQQQAQIDGWIAEAIQAVELEALRPTIVAQIGTVDSLEKAKARVTELRAREDIKLIAEALVERQAGPHAFVGGKGRGENPLKELDKAETISAARAWLGV